MHLQFISRTQSALARLALCGLMLAPTTALAEWDGGIEGGAVIRNGEQSNRIRLSLTNDTRPLSHYLYADWIVARGDDSYEAGYRPRYWFNKALYSFGELSFRIDKPIGIDRETTESLGMGYQFLQSPTQSAFAEVGAGARQLVFSSPLIDDLSQPFGRARVGYAQKIAEAVRFDLSAAATFSEDVNESNAEVGVTVNLGTLAITLGYRVIEQRINDQPVISDDTTTVSINYRL